MLRFRLPLLPGSTAAARLIARIVQARFAAAIVTWATLRSAALPFVARIPVRVGQARRLYSSLFTHRVVVRSELGDRSTHWTQILLDYARAIGCDTSDPKPDFVLRDDERAVIARRLAEAGVAERPYVVLHPTRGIGGAAGRWPAERLGDLGNALGSSLDAPVIVTGTAGDRAIAERVAARAGAISFAAQTTIGEFGALAAGARVVVAMDSGPMHVAAAVGAPTLGIFALASDEPERWAPIGARAAAYRGSYPCPPEHRKETCPTFACVEALDVARIVRQAEKLARDGA